MRPMEKAANDFDIARDRWAQVEAKRQALSNKLQGMELAISLAKSPQGAERVPSHARVLALARQAGLHTGPV